MRRRNLLQAGFLGATGLSGCLGMDPGPQSTPPEARKLASIGTSIDHDSLDIHGSIIISEINTQHTAGFELTVTWDGDEQKRVVFGNRIPFSYPKRSSKPPGIVLMPPQNQITPQDKGGWVPPTQNGEILSRANLVGKEFETGESVSNRWSVWATPKATFIRAGTYEFENELSVANIDAGKTDGEPVTWGLTIGIKNKK